MSASSQSSPISDSPTASALGCCCHLVVPAEVRLLAWGTPGPAQVREDASGTRVFVFAAPGTTLCLVGVPRETALATPDAWQQWWATHPMARPTMVAVNADGEAMYLPGETPLPTAVLEEPTLATARPLLEALALPALAEEALARLTSPAPVPAPPAAPALDPVSTVSPPASDPVEAAVSAATPAAEDPLDELDAIAEALDLLAEWPIVEGEALGVFPMFGEAPQLKADASSRTWRCYATAGTQFVVARAPQSLAADPAALADWYADHPGARATGYRVTPEGVVQADLQVLAAAERSARRRRGPITGLADPLDWLAVFDASESSLVPALRAQAVTAAGLRAALSTGQVPDVVMGSSGALYVRLASPWDAATELAVSGMVPDGTPPQILWVTVSVADGFGTDRHLYVPTGGAFVLAPVREGAARMDEARVVRVRPAGASHPLPALETTRVLSGAVPLRVLTVTAQNPHTRVVVPAPTTQEATPLLSAAPVVVSDDALLTPPAAPETPRTTGEGSPMVPAAAEPATAAMTDADDAHPLGTSAVAADAPPVPPTAAPLAAPSVPEPEIPVFSEVETASPDIAVAKDAAATDLEPAELSSPAAPAAAPVRSAAAEPQEAAAMAAPASNGPPEDDWFASLMGEEQHAVLDEAPSYAEADHAFGHDEMPAREPRTGNRHRQAEAASSYDGPLAWAPARPARNAAGGDARAERTATPRWHTPLDGFTNVSNWVQRSPRGELWAAELLDAAAADDAELDTLGCLVPMRLLRQGLPITRSDKALFQQVLTQTLRARVDGVRIMELEGKSYFARDTGHGIRLIGPRGLPVKSKKIRREVATAFGRSASACFEDDLTTARDAVRSTRSR